jgi:lantibiotic modifying enzyme
MNREVFIETIARMNRYTISNIQLDRRDWLFPADPAVFNTNPLNVAHGATGVLYGLLKTGGDIPQSALSWLLSHEITNDEYPPGIYVGLAGMAWVFWELGLEEEALKLMDQAEAHPLLLKSSNLSYGAAGYGMACLQFYTNTNEAKWLERAVRIGDWLIHHNHSTSTSKNYCVEPNGDTYLGLARGNSGVALFLLYLYQITHDKKFFEAGEAALQFDLAYLQETEEHHLSVPRGGIAAPEKVFTHYWLDGSAGISSVLWRYWSVSGNAEYYQIASSLALDLFRTFTVFPGLFRGASGLGNGLLDAYHFTGDSNYLEQAMKIGQGILLFQIHRDSGVAFPGEQLFRISTDYGTGMAGISLFLQRLINPQAEANFHFLLTPSSIEAAGQIEGVAAHE